MGNMKLDSATSRDWGRRLLWYRLCLCLCVWYLSALSSIPEHRYFGDRGSLFYGHASCKMNILREWHRTA
jgi:hypothetical protein